MASASVPLANKPGKTNWVERFHALPKDSWIRRAAEHIKAKGKPDSLAIPYAVNAAEKMCATGDTNLPGVQQVNAGSRAEACATLTVWKTAAAKAKASNLTARREVEQIDLARAYIAYRDGDRPDCPHGATTAYLDLSYDESKHPRGLAGRWAAAVNALKPGQSKTLHAATGTRIEKLSSGFRVHSNGTTQSAQTAAAAVAKAVDAANRAKSKKRVGSPAMNMSAAREALLLDLAAER